MPPPTNRLFLEPCRREEKLAGLGSPSIRVVYRHG
jgi:hypothetical protein